MQLATTAQTLDFLQHEYDVFRSQPTALQAQIMEFNELVRAPTEKAEWPLRVLYIDLLMHDEMLRRSRVSHDTKRARIQLLMRNKVMLQKLIRQREAVGESVTPDPRTELVVLELPWLLEWFPAQHRAAFERELRPLWAAVPLDPQAVLTTLLQQCVVLGCRTVEDFRALFSVIECVVYQMLTASSALSVEKSASSGKEKPS